MSEITLQINLSPGDLAYAELTVPALLTAHRATAFAEILLIVDCCRPQRTRIVDPDARGTAGQFRERAEAVLAMAETWKKQGLVNRVYALRPEDPLCERLASKYCRGLIHETHDYGNCALMSYLAALELPTSRYLVHYDADVLLHQPPNFDWVSAAVASMSTQPKLVAATPRISPPWTTDPSDDAPSRHEQRPAAKVPGGWANDWFSSRCFLFDLEKLQPLLPLLDLWQCAELLARKWLGRGYPPSPEMMLYRRLGPLGYRRLNLDTEEAWLLHPSTKPARYLELLPQILASTQRGECPESQRGQSEIQLAAWEEMLGQ